MFLAGVNVEPLLEMAGFQVSINGRFWVSTEATHRPRARNGSDLLGHGSMTSAGLVGFQEAL